MRTRGIGIGIPFTKLRGISNVIKTKFIGWWSSLINNENSLQNRIGLENPDVTGRTVFPGKAYDFDGTNHASKTFSSGTIQALILRINKSADTELLQLATGKSIAINAGLVAITGETGPVYVDKVNTTTVGNDAEHHIAINFDNPISLGAFLFGKVGATYGDFAARDLRLFEVVLTTDEIATAFDEEPLGDELAWWFCEDTDLVTGFDASGNGYYLTKVSWDALNHVEGTWQSLMNKYGYNIAIGGPSMMDAGKGTFDSGTESWTAYGNNTIENDNGALKITYIGGTQAERGCKLELKETSDININLVTGKLYKIQIKAKTNIGSSVTISEVNSATGITISIGVINSTSYVWNSCVFQCGENYISEYIRFYNDFGAGEIVWIDEWTIQEWYSTPVLPDMSTAISGIPSLDVLGNDLIYKGQVKYNPAYKKSACALGDGVIYMTITGLLTTDAITVETSSDTPTCTVNGRLDIAAGDEVYGVTIKRGGVLWAYIPMCEPSGGIYHDVSGNNNHATIVSGDETNFGEQDNFHYLQEKGYYKSGSTIVPALSDKTTDALGNTLTHPQNNIRLLEETTLQMPEKIHELIQADRSNKLYNIVTDVPEFIKMEDLNTIMGEFYIKKETAKKWSNNLILIKEGKILTDAENAKLLNYINYDLSKWIETRVGSETVTTAGTVITLSSEILYRSYAVFIRCFDGSGNNIDFVLEDKINDGFKITPVINGMVEYLAILNLNQELEMRAGSRPVVTAGTVIYFPELPSTVYRVVIRCFDSDDNNIDYSLTSKTVTGFTITPVTNATIEYIAIIDEETNIRVGSESVTTAGTPITFSSAMVSTNYATGIRCYDGSGNNIDFALTNKTVNGFTITPAINGTIDYIAKVIEGTAGGGAYENFTTYTEVDTGGHITVATNKLTGIVPETAESYVYKDFGVDYFNADYEMQFQINVAASSEGASIGVLILANDLDDCRALDQTNKGAHVRVTGTTAVDWDLRLALEWQGTSNTISALSYDTDYYCTVTRDDNGGTSNKGRYVLTVYSDSARTVVVGTATVDSSAIQKNWRYLYPMSGYKVGDADIANVVIDNLEIISP